jgi:spore coat protein U-like protein
VPLGRALKGLCIGGAVLGFAGSAEAQTCSFSFTDVAFGSSVDVTTGGAYDTTGTFSANCTGTASSTVRICPHIGAGSGGAGANGSPRTMAKGADTLSYNLYKDSSRTAVWGSYLTGWSATPPEIDLSLSPGGSGSINTTVYGRVAGSQNTAAVGAYTSSFSTADVKVRYAYASAADCSTIDATHESGQTFTVSGTVQARCTVSATNLNFGSAGVIASAYDAQNTISIVCTRDAPYQIALGAGLNDGGLGINGRKLKAGSETIGYQLYRDSGRTLVWGNTLNTDTKSGTGSGSTQTHDVYGRVPAQTTPSPGTYTDTIVVTVEY